MTIRFSTLGVYFFTRLTTVCSPMLRRPTHPPQQNAIGDTEQAKCISSCTLAHIRPHTVINPNI